MVAATQTRARLGDLSIFIAFAMLIMWLVAGWVAGELGWGALVLLLLAASRVFSAGVMAAVRA